MKYLLVLPVTILILLTYYTYNKLFNVEKNNIQNIEIAEIENIPEEIVEKIKLQNKEDLEKDKIVKESPIVPFNKEDENIKLDIIESNKEDVLNNLMEFENDINIDEKFDIVIFNTDYSSNIDNVLKFSGENIEQIEYIEIGGEKYKSQVIDSDIFIVIKENNILNGEYILKFHTIYGNIIEYTDKINFRYENGSTIITNITPVNVDNTSNRNIVLQGKGFNKIISIQLSNNIVFKETSFNIITDNVMSVLIPKDIIQGEYTLNLMSVDGIYKSSYKFRIFNK